MDVEAVEGDQEDVHNSEIRPLNHGCRDEGSMNEDSSTGDKRQHEEKNVCDSYNNKTLQCAIIIIISIST